MRIKSLFMAFLAGALALVACKQEQSPNDLPPSITVTPNAVTFEQSEGSQKLEVKATRNWTVSGIPEWIALTPTTGEASLNASDVIISVLANSGNDREATLSFSIGLAKQAVTVKQKGAKGEIDNGKGTKESPYSVAGAVAFIQTLGSDVESTEKIYIKGKISTVETTFGASGNYGNATFNMVDEAGSDVVFKAFQTYYLGNRKWKTGDTEVKEGDEVIIYGPVVNYKGNTPETVGKGASFIYSLNGVTDGGDQPPVDGEAKGDGSLNNPYNPAGAAAYAQSFGKDVQSDKSVYIKGKISSVETTYEASGSYGNASFTIVDATDGTGSFYVFQTYYLGNRKWKSGETDVKVGDEVIVYGPVVNYKGNTPETVGKGASYVYSLNGVTGGDDPGPDPGEVQQISCAEFIQKADQNTVYRLVGEVTSDVNTQYCSFDMNDGTATVVVWSVNNKDEWKNVVKKGGTVTVRGKYQPYTDKNGNLKHEMVDAYIEDFKAGGTPDPGGDDQPSGNGTLDSPYNPKAAYDVAAALASDAKSDDVYISGKISSIKYTFSADYGTATFNISEDGSTSGTQLPCYSVYYLGNRAWVNGDTQIAVGDRVIIYGKLTNYQGNTPETASKSAYIYSLNGKTGGDDPGPGPDPGGEVQQISCAEFIQKADQNTVYRLVGEVTSDVNTQYCSFDMNDGTATVVVWTVNNKDEWKDVVKKGGTVTVRGKYQPYTDKNGNLKHEMVDAYIEDFKAGDDPGPGPDPGEAKAVTVAQFIAAPESDTQVYQLTGTIGGTINSTYGNFDLTDDSGTVYVYGLTATNLGYGANNDKSYSSLGLGEGDKITIKGYRGSFNGKVEVLYAWFVEKISGGDPGPGPSGDFASNVTWTAGSDNAYDQDATVNGTSGVKVLKLGKGSDWGKSTLTLPAGSSTLSFYAVSWNNADVASLVFSVNGKEVATVTPKANSGLAGNPTYTLTVSDSDHYTVNLGSSATTVEVKTTGGYRAALFGIVAQ